MNNFPENFEFSTILPICIEHINYGNHLGHDRLISLLHEARVRFLQKRGFDERSLLMKHLEIEYLKEGFHGDLLTISISYQQQGPCSGIVYYLVKRDNDLLAKATTTVVFYDYAKRKIVRGSL